MKICLLRPVTLIGAVAAVAVALSGCVDKAINGLTPSTTCAAGDIVLTLTSPKITPRAGDQHVDSITVNAMCSKPPPGAPLAGAAIQVTWPGGSTTVGTTDSAGNVTITSSVFPTSGGAGTVIVSANGNDGQSQNEKTSIQ
jgi:hypothetical protein